MFIANVINNYQLLLKVAQRKVIRETERYYAIENHGEMELEVQKYISTQKQDICVDAYSKRQ